VNAVLTSTISADLIQHARLVQVATLAPRFYDITFIFLEYLNIGQHKGKSNGLLTRHIV
jgi:hypothetical protein